MHALGVFGGYLEKATGERHYPVRYRITGFTGREVFSGRLVIGDSIARFTGHGWLTRNSVRWEFNDQPYIACVAFLGKGQYAYGFTMGENMVTLFAGATDDLENACLSACEEAERASIQAAEEHEEYLAEQEAYQEDEESFAEA